MSESHKPDLFQFQTPSVRHLAWLCHAPQLLSDPSVFYPDALLPDDYVTTLQAWDQNPGARPSILDATPHYRLGLYVESLYACLIQDLLGWTILARNLPVRTGKLTLGELDFLIHNPYMGVVEHHEIAIKFYLGYGGSAAAPAGWYGPNAQDRLDIKTARLLEQQSPRGLMPETAQVLEQLGIALPKVSRVFMPGYLFYQKVPVNHKVPTRGASTSETAPHFTAMANPVLSATTPDSVPSNHLRGHWMYLDDVAEIDTTKWVPLIKPHWLGPWGQAEVPDSTDSIQVLSEIEDKATPGLFAILQHDSMTGLWKETDRVFVVPSHWPRRL
ncbi:MAG: DUF1853 family protein [Pseudohongiella sp.]|nr:DUF1853 family protein [Pseudohongiella sp.]MDP2128140.1 DUF1853 family protein [Pseudohongiella sp.]